MVFGPRDYDRRKSKRFNTEICTNYSTAKVRTESGGEGMITNLSKSGLEMDLYDKLKRRTRILVEVPAKWLSTNLTLSGSVVWVKPCEDLVSCGIKIDWVSNEEEYREYIERLEVRNRR